MVPREIGKVGAGAAGGRQGPGGRRAHLRGEVPRAAAATLGFDVYATIAGPGLRRGGGGARARSPAPSARRRGRSSPTRGEPIEAYYHSTCAGRTAAIEEVWPQERPRPYLVSVVDVNPATGRGLRPRLQPLPVDGALDAPRSSSRSWTRTLADSLPGRRRLHRRDPRTSRSSQRTTSGRVEGDAHLDLDGQTSSSAATGSAGSSSRRRGASSTAPSSTWRSSARRRGAAPRRSSRPAGAGGTGSACARWARWAAPRAGQDYRTILARLLPRHPHRRPLLSRPPRRGRPPPLANGSLP